MNKYIGIVWLGLLLGACQKTEAPPPTYTEANPAQTTKAAATDALKALDEKLSVTPKITTAKDVRLEAIPFVYALPESVQKLCQNPLIVQNQSCVDIDIVLAKTEPVWIEQIVNKVITDDDSPKRLKFTRKLDDFVAKYQQITQENLQQTQNSQAESPLVPYRWHMRPRWVSALNNVAQVAIDIEVYTGGAHGMYAARYVVLDMDLQSQVGLSDVVLPDQAPALYEAAYEIFKQYLSAELQINTPKALAEYEETWPFVLGEDFYFAQEGLTLVYQPYHLGSYAQGIIELVVPYDVLQTILRPQYLPKA